MRLFSRTLLVGLIFTVSAVNALAAELHGSYKVAESYLSAIHLHQWESAVKLVETKSLENLKVFQKNYLLRAPTIAEEQELLRLLGMTDISDIDAMRPAEVFVRRGKAKTKKLVSPDKHIEQMKKTLKIKTLGTVEEGDSTVHAVIRKEFAADEKGFSELAFVSLVKDGTVWKVSLDAQEPKVFSLKPKKK
jgi:hypothetical protein